MIIEFANEELRLLIEEGDYSSRQYKKLKSNKAFQRDLIKVVSFILAADDLEQLRTKRSLNVEALRGDLGGRYSLRIGFTSKYRLIFECFEDGIKILIIEISEHYDDK